MTTPLAINMPGMDQWLIVAVVGLIFFGKRLPEVGRSLGKGIVEFKKGLSGIEEEVNQASAKTTTTVQPMITAEAKFDPMTGKPLQAKFDPYTGKPIGEAVTSETSNPPPT